MWVASLLMWTAPALSIDLHVNSSSSIKDAAAVVAKGLMNYYQPDIGAFACEYCWWQLGQAAGALIDYQYFTGSKEYEPVVHNILAKQSQNQYRPTAQIGVEGNDDQSFFGFALLTALERNFTKIEGLDYERSVINITQQQIQQWDTRTCGGGLRWQYRQENVGWDSKTMVTNGGLYALCGRLARWTNDSQYVEMAETVWEWTVEVALQRQFAYYDNADVKLNCSEVDHTQWTYNPAFFLVGSAYLLNATGNDTYLYRTNSILDGMEIFYANGTICEIACEPDECDKDQASFKGVVARFLASTRALIPETAEQIRKYLEPSAQGAARSCSGGTDGVTCGVDWTRDSWDEKYGIGEQLSALETIQSLLATSDDAPLHGSSK